MLNSVSRRGAIACVLAFVAAAACAEGSLIISGADTDHAVVAGSLDDVRLSVDLSVSGSVATMTFTNVSVAPETSAVFRLIVVDTTDDDTATAIFWNGSVVTNTADVSYDLEAYNVLPEYNPPITDGTSMVQFEANPDPPTHGIGPGEVLVVQFDTSLADGSDIDDYLAAFDGGADTRAYSIGFHAISATVVNDESLSGALIPEPTALAVLVIGGLVLARRRRRA